MSEVSKQNDPELRFPEFDGEWEATLLGNIASFKKGKGISKSDIVEDGKTPCIRYGQLYTDYDTLIDEPISYTNVPKEELVLSAGNEVIIPASGETAEDIATAAVILQSGIALGGDLNIIETTLDGFFLASYMSGAKRQTLAKFAQGNSVVHIYPNHLRLLQLTVPSLPEQQKIASFLSAVDEKIALLERKKALLEDYKKGVMQKLFSQTLRFKDDDGNEFPDWEEKRFGYLGDFNGGGTPNTNINSYWDGKIPWISSSDIVDNEIKNVSITRYITEKAVIESAAKIIPKGSLLIVSRVGVGKLCISPIDLCTSQDFCNFTPKNLNSKYLGYLLIANKNTLLSLCQGTSIKGLTSKELKALKIPIPHKNEQQKIADFLSAIDTKITHTGEQLAQAKAFKKGLLQKMFV